MSSHEMHFGAKYDGVPRTPRSLALEYRTKTMLAGANGETMSCSKFQPAAVRQNFGCLLLENQVAKDLETSGDGVNWSFVALRPNSTLAFAQG